MQLSKRSDQALRLLMYLALTGEDFVSLGDVAAGFAIPEGNLRKLTPALAERGWIETLRGPHGGVRLAVDASKITVGDVVRELETLSLLECFDSVTSTCPATGCCSLEGVINAALNAFLARLDQTTIAQMARPRPAFQRAVGLPAQ